MSAGTPTGLSNPFRRDQITDCDKGVVFDPRWRESRTLDFASFFLLSQAKALDAETITSGW